MKTFENKHDCPLVEQIIWDNVASCCGDFCGVKELSFADLCALKAAAELQLSTAYNNAQESFAIFGEN